MSKNDERKQELIAEKAHHDEVNAHMKEEILHLKAVTAALNGNFFKAATLEVRSMSHAYRSQKAHQREERALRALHGENYHDHSHSHRELHHSNRELHHSNREPHHHSDRELHHHSNDSFRAKRDYSATSASAGASPQLPQKIEAHIHYDQHFHFHNADGTVTHVDKKKVSKATSSNYATAARSSDKPRALYRSHSFPRALRLLQYVEDPITHRVVATNDGMDAQGPITHLIPRTDEELKKLGESFAKLVLAKIDNSRKEFKEASGASGVELTPGIVPRRKPTVTKPRIDRLREKEHRSSLPTDSTDTGMTRSRKESTNSLMGSKEKDRKNRRHALDAGDQLHSLINPQETAYMYLDRASQIEHRQKHKVTLEQMDIEHEKKHKAHRKHFHFPKRHHHHHKHEHSDHKDDDKDGKAKWAPWKKFLTKSRSSDGSNSADSTPPSTPTPGTPTPGTPTPGTPTPGTPTRLHVKRSTNDD